MRVANGSMLTCAPVASPSRNSANCLSRVVVPPPAVTVPLNSNDHRGLTASSTGPRLVDHRRRQNAHLGEAQILPPRAIAARVEAEGRHAVIGLDVVDIAPRQRVLG